MKKFIFAFVVSCVLAGCTQTGEQKDIVKIGGQSYKGVPVELQLPGDESLAVELRGQNDRGVPVRIDIKDGRLLPVGVNVQGDKGLPVEVKLPRITLIFIGIAVLAIVIIAVVTCFAAIGAARSAKAACHSADAISKSRQMDTD